ncbi:Hypothetical protein, putative, partial [Bodo saltans]
LCGKIAKKIVGSPCIFSMLIVWRASSLTPFLCVSSTFVIETTHNPSNLMDPLVAARVRKPRRTNSAPGSAVRAARNRTLPNALMTALLGKRETLPQFAVKSLLSADRRVASDNNAESVQPDLRSVAADAPSAVPSTIPPSLSTEALQEIDMQDILQQMNESSSTHQHHPAKRASKDSSSALDDEEETDSSLAVNVENAAEEYEEPDRSSAGGDSSRTASKERPEEDAEGAEDVEFDVDETRYLFNKLKETTGYCSEKVSNFVIELWEQLGEGEAGRMMLGRDAMAAPAVASSRKRRLFGAKEPELHQRVLGVLNKVTDDKSKYREIKFELMRLPLPEADPVSLEQVVKCFFAKAVREQRFSSHYADLVEEICRVPPNQIQLGDTTQSLSYRLRVALLRRCQEEFANHRSMVEIARDAAKKNMSADEIENLKAEEKNKLCGNVKFVGELFLRKMVSARIIQLILLQLFWGTNDAEVLKAPVPPKYVPEAYECDQVITMLMTTGEVLIKSELGAQTVAALIKLAKYFTQHHPVQRTRFVLLDLIDAEARKFGKKVPGAPRTKIPTTPEPPAPAATTPVSANKAIPAPSYTIARRPDAAPPASVGAMPQGRSGAPPALSTDSPLSSRTPNSSLPSSATKAAAPQSPLTVGTPKRAPVSSTTLPVKAMIPAPRSAGSASPMTVAALIKLAKYFTQHHPVQRTRFVLLDLIDAEARKFGKKVPGAPRTKIPTTPEPPAPAATTPVSANKAIPAPSYTIARRPDAAPPASVGAMPQGRSGAPPALSTDSPLSSRTPNSSLPSSATKAAAPQSPLTVGTPKRAPVSSTTLPVKAMIPAPRSAGSASPMTPSSNTSGMASALHSNNNTNGAARVAPTVELIGPLMSSLVTSSDYTSMALELVSTFTSVKVAMELWAHRALNLIKAETERYQIGPLLSALQKEHGVPVQDLRQTVVDALYRCIEAQLHEGGYRLWKYWAQIVAGDTAGVVLDDQLHNDVFQHVLDVTLDPDTNDIDKTIARAFIVDVITVDATKSPDHFISSSRFTSTRSTYARFRPLNVLTNAAVALAKGTGAAVGAPNAARSAAPLPAAGSPRGPTATIPATKVVLDIIACPAIAKLQDVELATFVGIIKGKPSRSELLDLYRGDKVFHSCFTPAKVLSAVYHSEYAEQARSFLDECMDLLVFVIDSSDRHLRELALVMELYHSIKGITVAPRSMNEGQRWMSRLKLSNVVTVETHTLAHQRLQHDRDADFAIGPATAQTSNGRQNTSASSSSHDGGARVGQRTIQNHSFHQDQRR